MHVPYSGLTHRHKMMHNVEQSVANESCSLYVRVDRFVDSVQDIPNYSSIYLPYHRDGFAHVFLGHHLP